MSIEFELPASSVRLLEKRINRAGKRAPASGLPQPSFRVVENFTRAVTLSDPLARMRGREDVRVVQVPMVRVEVVNFAPDLGEWRVFGYRQNVRGVVYNWGEVSAKRRGGPLCCDHCGVARRRDRSIVLRHRDTQQEREVGTTCLEAFVGNGHTFADRLSDYARILADAERMSEGEVTADVHDVMEEVQVVLAFASARITADGYLSGRQAYGTDNFPTWRLVQRDLERYRQPGASEDDFLVTAFDFVFADEIIDAYRGRGDDSSLTGFEQEVAAAVTRGVASLRDVAILTAAVDGFRRERRREAEDRDRRTIAALSRTVASEGERIDFVGRVLKVSSYPGRWGVRRYITILDQNDNLLRWKTGEGAEVSEGRAYEMRGTVKAHGRFEGGPFAEARMTELSRVSVGEDLGPFTLNVKAPAEVADDTDEMLDAVFGGP